MPNSDKSQRFLQVIDTHKGIIYKVANSYCNNTEDRKDLIQEISVQLWKAFENYKPEFKYSTWIYRIALNVAISFYRKGNVRKTKELTEDILHLADRSDGSEHDERMKLLYRFIHSLKEFDRALLLLYLEERPYREIAEIIGISESNVSTKIARIKSILKQNFSKFQSY